MVSGHTNTRAAWANASGSACESDARPGPSRDGRQGSVGPVRQPDLGDLAAGVAADHQRLGGYPAQPVEPGGSGSSICDEGGSGTAGEVS
jgi:hypothetical protein